MEKGSNENNGRTIIQVIQEDGSVVDCEVLFAFSSAETGKKYAVFTDNKVQDENGNVMVSVTAFEEGNTGMELIPIETDEEWDYVGKVLADMQSGMEQGI